MRLGCLVSDEADMPNAISEDTEITLGTGKMLALFFGLVALCAVFFAFGFSLGRSSVLKPSAAETLLPASTASPAVVRPSAVKNASTVVATSDANTTAAGSKEADPQTTATTTPAAEPDASTPAAEPQTTQTDPIVAPPLNGYYVQVAAVSKQEDADALVDALKKKQYPAFSASSVSDKLFHIQLGPYSDIKEAEGMRAKLVGDGYNPILKK